MWQPKIITTSHAYSWSLFMANLMAGLTVAMVELPLGIAIAIGIALRLRQCKLSPDEMNSQRG